MSALINVLDNSTLQNQTPPDLQIGENGHPEYSWTGKWTNDPSELKEQLVQLSFQLIRCDSSVSELLGEKLRQLLYNLHDKRINKNDFVELITIAYKIMGHTRDIINGKGEYSLAYMQILIWNELYPELARFMLLNFVQHQPYQPLEKVEPNQPLKKVEPKTNNLNDDLAQPFPKVDFPKVDDHPYGSWKDIKYFCNYCKSKRVEINDPLMQYAFNLLLNQLKIDIISNDVNKSLASKWAPRANSKRFGWIFNELSVMYFKEYINTAVTPDQKTRAINKCKMSFRKLLADMNRKLDTTQIHQCDGTWSEIDHNKTTSITLTKQKKAFLNIKKNNEQRSENPDRIKCAENFTEYIQNVTKGECEIKGKRVSMSDFTKQAIELIQNSRYNKIDNYKTEIDLLNSQWRDNSKQTGNLGKLLAMLDFSGSMQGDPINTAMALGCRVAEKSILGKRVLSFSNNPTWHNLDECDTFVDMIRVLLNGEVGFSTNFYNAFNKILDAIIENKLRPDQVENMILGIFSDMQIDDPNVGAPNDMDSFYSVIEKKYAETGMRIWGEPFKPPHILFWNLRSTTGFPSLSTQKNVSMMSGYSPALLNLFCEKGIDALQSCTPWSILSEQLNNSRYKCLDNKIKEYDFDL